MTLIEFGSLSIIYFISLILIFILIYYEYRQIRFNFNIFFSSLYLLIFYLGFPLTGLLIFKFNIKVVPLNSLLYELILSIGFYIIYYIAYKISLINIVKQSKQSLFTMNGVETRLTCFLLMFIAISAVCIFLLQNGFLLFSLKSYNQIFSNEVYNVGLKRFFYFFIPSMLIIFFLKPTKNRWFFFYLVQLFLG